MAGDNGLGAGSVAKPAKVKIEVRVSAADNEIARRLAEKREIAVADVFGQAIERGLPILIEEDNRIEWWKNVAAQGEIRQVLEALPKDRYGEALEYLKRLQED